MATRVIDDTKLNNIAVAIQAKDSGGQMTVDDMPTRIGALPLVEPINENSQLILVDWEGNVLYGYTRQEALALTSIPDADTFNNYQYGDHEYLEFAEWNWDLVDVKSWLNNHKKSKLYVGAIYSVTDNQDHYYWENENNDAQRAAYKVKCNRVMGSWGGFNDYAGLKFLSLPPNKNVEMPQYGFQQTVLNNINIPKSIITFGTTPFYQSQVNAISFSGKTVAMTKLQDNNTLERISMPDLISSLPTYFVNHCGGLSELDVPTELINVPTKMCYSCIQLVHITLFEKVETIAAQAFQYCISLQALVLRSKPTLADVNAIANTSSNFKVYVFKDDLSWFENETKWSALYSQGKIVAAEDNLEFLDNLGVDISVYNEEVTA